MTFVRKEEVGNIIVPLLNVIIVRKEEEVGNRDASRLKHVIIVRREVL